MPRLMLSFLLLLACVVSAAPAAAQSTNAAPVLVVTTTALDPATLPLTDDTDKKNVTDYLTGTKTATGNSALVAAANMTGVLYYFGTTANPSSTADAARVGLELCEYLDRAPCFILSINGNDARGTDGAWPAQPEMLVKTAGSRFDAWMMPFNSQFNRAIGGWLANAPTPEAVVVSTAGGWSASSGKTILEAITSAYASCLKTYPNNLCLLYSVDGTVVMAQ
jgi:hypothetical protein